MTTIPTPTVLSSAVTMNPPNRRAMLIGLASVPFAASAIPTVAIAATSTGWQRVVREFNTAAAVTSALPEDASDDMFDTVTTIHNDKLQAVKAYPVTTLAMLREKMDLLVKEYGIDDLGSGDEFEHVYADVKRIGGVS